MNNKEQSQSIARSEQTRTFICNFSLPLCFISVINVMF